MPYGVTPQRSKEAVLVTTLLPCGVTPQGSCTTSYHTPGMWSDTTGKLYYLPHSCHVPYGVTPQRSREAVLVTTLMSCGVTQQGSCTSYHTPAMWGDTSKTQGSCAGYQAPVMWGDTTETQGSCSMLLPCAIWDDTTDTGMLYWLPISCHVG